MENFLGEHYCQKHMYWYYPWLEALLELREWRLKIRCICSGVINIILAIITCNQCIRAMNGGCGFSCVRPHLNTDTDFSKCFLDIIL